MSFYRGRITITSPWMAKMRMDMHLSIDIHRKE